MHYSLPTLPSSGLCCQAPAMDLGLLQFKCWKNSSTVQNSNMNYFFFYQSAASLMTFIITIIITVSIFYHF